MDTAKARQLVDEIASRTDELRTLIGDDSPPPTNVIRVKVGDDLQKAINSAKGGDTIRVQPGIFRGNFTLPARGETTTLPVTIRPDVDDGNLAPSGRWITKDHASALVRLESADGLTESLRTLHGAQDYILLGLEFPPLHPSRTQLSLGTGKSEGQVTFAQMPRGFKVDRCYFHGDPMPGKGQHRGIAANCGGLHVTGSYFGDFFEVGRDSQAICGWNGYGPILIENSFLEASGENVLFGGAGPGIDNLVPSDITIRGCKFTKNPAWRAHPTPPSVKNLFEIKNALRVLVEGNVFENCWLHGQAGHAWLLKAANTDGFDVWSVCQQVVLRYNLLRKVGGVLSINNSEGAGPTRGTRDIRVSHNLAYDINETFPGDGRIVLIGGGPETVVIDHNTLLGPSAVKGNSFLTVYDKGQTIKDGRFTNNIVREAQYGLFGAGSAALGLTAFTDYYPNGVFNGNAIEQGGARSIAYGPNNMKIGFGQLDSMMDADYKPNSGSLLAGVPTTDNLTVGADVPQILSRLKDLL